ncbi:hypothetical protein vBAspATola_14 [Aeromonas phage vB_AspA_Tola]|nr:hypothetical protein vBAspATola_14 [Aeromonas phage vB_AspA_Tola]
MTVYLVKEHAYNGGYVLAAYFDKDKATKHRDEYNSTSVGQYDKADIEELEVTP